MSISSSSSQSNNNPKVKYYRGAIGARQLIENEDVAANVKKLLTGEYGKGDLEKLKGRDIYSIRMTGKERLLFKIMRRPEGPTILLLEYLEDHKYERSSFLNLPRSHLNQFSKKAEEKKENGDFTYISLDEEDERQIEDLTVTQDQVDFIPQPLDYYSSKFISLSDQQEEAVTKKTPLFINGAPGAGKTLAAMALLTKEVSLGNSVCYVTLSTKLARKMKENWREQPLSSDQNVKQPTILSYLELLQLFGDDSSKNKQFVTEEQFKNWFSIQSKRLQKMETSNNHEFVITNEDQRAVYEEFQLLSAYTKEEYLGLGNRKSLFEDTKSKKVVWDLYQEYKKWLKHKNIPDPKVAEIGRKDIFDLVIVDEAADLPTFALKELIGLAKGFNIVLCFDTNQDLEGVLSKRAHIEEIFHKRSKEIDFIDLDDSHRCAKKILGLANRCLDLKRALMRGKSDKYDYPKVHANTSQTNKTGDVAWDEDDLSVSYGSLIHKHSEPKVAIIAEPHYHKEIKEKLKDVILIFTPAEIKGLEFPGILIYRPFESEIFRKINQKLSSMDSEMLSEKKHLPKKQLQTEQERKEILSLNQLFTSITRAEESLTIYQPKSKKTRYGNIKEHLLTPNHPEKCPRKIVNDQLKPETKSSTEEWLELAKTLYFEGNEKHFTEVCTEKLNMSKEEVLEILHLNSSERETSKAPKNKRKKRKKKTVNKQDISSEKQPSHLNSLDTHESPELSFKRLTEAANQGDAEAQNSLAKCYKDGLGIEKNLVEAFRYFKMAAEKGNTDAKCYLAYFYLEGIATNKCVKKAFSLTQEAAKQGHVGAQFELTCFYREGIGTKKNEQEAFKWTKKAAEQGDAEAQSQLAHFYLEGIGTNKNEQEAFKLYAEAAEQGDFGAKYNLGLCYYNGEGTDKNQKKAFELFKISATQGKIIEALFMLGVCYENGDGTNKNEQEAFNCYKEAAKQGYAEAQYNLAVSYQHGTGTAKNIEKAFQLFEKLAKQGHDKARKSLAENHKAEKKLNDAFDQLEQKADKGDINAQFQLGKLYQRGVGRGQNKEEAFKYFKNAADQGHPDAQYNVGKCYGQGIGTEQNTKEALKWYKKAADQGDANAMSILGQYYEKVNGTEQNLEEAFVWHWQAAEQGLAEAQYNLGVCYFHGNGTEQNLEEAFLWCKKAADQGFTNAQRNLTTFYRKCVTSKNPDLKKVFLWIKKTAEEGFANAQFDLALFYLQGIATNKDEKEALKWLKKAAAQGNVEAQEKISSLDIK